MTDGDDDAPVGDAGLGVLRARIDELDRALVDLLNERARVVVDVGKFKRGTTIPIYAPHREAAVLRQALSANVGPLPDRTIEGVFRELMSGSFALEQPLRIGYLGPPGSFDHVAAVAHFGSSVSFEDLREVGGVFTEVRRGHVDYGLVPIDNLSGVAIRDTMDAFLQSTEEVFVYAEIVLSSRYALLANCQPSEIRCVYSKPEVLAQCRHWLATQYPRADQIGTASTSQAVQNVRAAYDTDPTCGACAIGSSLAGSLYGVNVLFSDIEDTPNTRARFFVIARQQAQRSGDDKTSILFTTRNEPGVLARVLAPFEAAKINITHINTRPSRHANWNDSFFLDVQGHREDPSVRDTLAQAARACEELRVLGSYPRAARVL